ncbi:MAG: hypothetical protein IJB67_07355 [Firmicutes bacterium]|nr:hypothetical protein [Bacillota bacterium]
MAYLLFGMAIGVTIGRQYYKHQIVRKHNPKVLAEVKGWLAEAEQADKADK